MIQGNDPKLHCECEGRSPVATLFITRAEIDAARRMWQTAAARVPASLRVDALFAEGLDTDGVIAQLRADSTLSTTDRTLAISQARARGLNEDLPKHRLATANASRLVGVQSTSWSIATNPDHDRATYEGARRALEHAMSLVPDDRRMWNTLGVLRYRLERYEDALAAFEKAEGLNDVVPGGYHAAHYRVWQAPCHYYLGDTARARALLAEVRAAPASDLARINAYIIEAAAIIEAADPVRR